MHTTVQRHAKPLDLQQLERVNRRLQARQAHALQEDRLVEVLRAARDRSMLLLGFWRAFRSVRMRIEDVARRCWRHLAQESMPSSAIMLLRVPVSAQISGNRKSRVMLWRLCT